MNQRIRYTFPGYIKIRLWGASPERFLNLCAHSGIHVWGLKSTREMGVYELYADVTKEEDLHPICDKTGTRILVLHRYGMQTLWRRYGERKCLLLGMGICLILPFILQLFIWNIQVTGNEYRTNPAILETLEEHQIKAPIWKSKVSCGKIIRILRKEYDDIIWTTASIRGSTLSIRIKENQNQNEEEEKGDTGTTGYDLVSAQEGVIDSIVVRKGTPMVHPKDQVKKGTVLVSGRLDVTGDDEAVVRSHYIHADADVFIRSRQYYEDQVMDSCVVKKPTGIEKEQYLIRIGNFKIRVGSKTKTFPTYIGIHRIMKRGPVQFERNQLIHYENREKKVTRTEQEKQIRQHFQRFCEKLEEKGVVISENNVKIIKSAHSYKAQGYLTVLTREEHYERSQLLSTEKGE